MCKIPFQKQTFQRATPKQSLNIRIMYYVISSGVRYITKTFSCSFPLAVITAKNHFKRMINITS